MRHLNIDIETYSSVNLKTGGLYKYAQAPDFDILLFGYSLDGAAPVVLDLTAGDAISPELRRLLGDPGTVKHAYNAAFEWYCISRYLGLTGAQRDAWLPQWLDTMMHALYCGLPASLAAVGEALNLPRDKRKLATGKALIRTFCSPRTPTERDPRTRILPKQEPEKWKLFCEYNGQDVVTEQTVEQLLSPWPVPAEVQRQWETDILINARGIAADMSLISGALSCGNEVAAQLKAEAIAISGLQNPNSVAQLTKWIGEEIDEEVKDLRKDTVSKLLADGVPSSAAQRMLEIRQDLGKTSVKKYDAMVNAACADNRIRGTLMFYGAGRTGRWAGRLVQVQNLPRTHLPGIDFARDLVRRERTEDLRMCYGSVPDTLSQLIRTALVASPGCRIVDADYSAIEARVIAWLAGEEWVMEVFRTHGRIYEATASQMFGVPLDRIARGNPEYDLRQKGKVATLALGYGGGIPALQAMRRTYHIPEEDLPDEELPGIRDRWRASNRRICAYWTAINTAALEALTTGRPQTVRSVTFALTGSGDQRFLTVRLPSGRSLFYAQPFLTTDRWGRDSLGYYGTAGQTWAQLETYGGKLVENITQAVARDCLAFATENLRAAGYNIVFHVHDEVVIDCPEERSDLDEICRIMEIRPAWAADLPLKAAGWVGDYYTKD